MTETGGSPITSYKLQVDSGSGFETVIGDPVDNLATTILVNQGIQSGQEYLFRFSVKNIHGFSDYSDPPFAITATSGPDSPTAVRSVNNEFQNFVTIDWEAPLNTGGDGIVIS